MATLKAFKTTGAILLAVALFLPLGSCEGIDRPLDSATVPEGYETSTPEQKSEQIEEKLYAYTFFLEADIESWSIGLSFVWPVTLVLVYAVLGSGSFVTFLKLIEPLLVLWTAYVLGVWRSFGISNMGGLLRCSRCVSLQ